MLNLRSEVAQFLARAIAQAQADNVWPAGLRPASFSLVEAPPHHQADISWPGLRSLANADHPPEELSRVLQKYLVPTPEAPFQFVGITAGFVNFAWTNFAYARILRWGLDNAARHETAIANLLASATDSKDIYAIRRTYWLEKMARDQYGEQLRITHYALRIGFSSAFRIPILQRSSCPLPMVFRARMSCMRSSRPALQLRITHYALRIIERVPHIIARAQQKQKPSLLRAFLDELIATWSTYYERYPLLKGPIDQVREHLYLSRTVRTAIFEVRTAINTIGAAKD